MHIMEGFLPIEWALFWWGVTLPSLIIGLLSIKKKLQEHPEFKMMLGLSGAFAFVLSALKCSTCLFPYIFLSFFLPILPRICQMQTLRRRVLKVQSPSQKADIETTNYRDPKLS